MCGRYTIAAKEEALRKKYNLSAAPEPIHRYNAAPGQTLPLVTIDAPNRLDYMRWGLIPHWSPDIKRVKPNINARLETARTKNYFKKAFNDHRCLVPATGYYEWKKEGRQKTPYYLHLPDHALFSLAGLYDEWPDPETGELIQTFAILTQSPFASIAFIHDRMPVPLSPESEKAWLNPDSDPADLADVLQNDPLREQFIHYTVSTAVNRVSNDDSSLLKPFQAPIQTTLW